MARRSLFVMLLLALPLLFQLTPAQPQTSFLSIRQAKACTLDA